MNILLTSSVYAVVHVLIYLGVTGVQGELLDKPTKQPIVIDLRPSSFFVRHALYIVCHGLTFSFQDYIYHFLLYIVSRIFS